MNIRIKLFYRLKFYLSKTFVLLICYIIKSSLYIIRWSIGYGGRKAVSKELWELRSSCRQLFFFFPVISFVRLSVGIFTIQPPTPGTYAHAHAFLKTIGDDGGGLVKLIKTRKTLLYCSCLHRRRG